MFRECVGSTKTLMSVRDIYLSPHRKVYSNIQTTMKHQIDISPNMIIKEDIISTKKNKATGKEEPVYKYKVNLDFWKQLEKPIDIVIDEAHSILNARRSMSKVNVIISDWLALIRRIVGQDSTGEGNLILISQLWNRIDVIARDMANQVRYHKCHYKKTCLSCGLMWNEHSEMPEKTAKCYACGSLDLFKSNYVAEIWKFPSMANFQMWNQGFSGSKGSRPYYSHYFIQDLEKFFPMYNTLQFDNLFSEYYS